MAIIKTEDIDMNLMMKTTFNEPKNFNQAWNEKNLEAKILARSNKKRIRIHEKIKSLRRDRAER